MMFAIVFGLSMDYQVFLVSRIFEEWHRRGDNREAVTHGLAATGRTITAAAAIMILVFGSFILGGERILMLFGLGLAGAVLLDALIVRSVLVPGLMLLAGKANWWLPRSLDRVLPRLNVEGQRRGRDPRAASSTPTPTSGNCLGRGCRVGIRGAKVTPKNMWSQASESSRDQVITAIRRDRPLAISPGAWAVGWWKEDS